MARCLALMLFFVPQQASSLTPAGTEITHSFSASFGAPSPTRTATSNQTRVAVKDLADPVIVPPRSAATPAGRPLDFVHTVSNMGNSADSFRLNAACLDGALPGEGSRTGFAFFAADGVTPLPGDGSGFALLGPIAAGASLDLVLRVIPQAGSEGRVEQIRVTAASVQYPLRHASLIDQLLVPAADGLAPPVKSVAPGGAVLPGSILTYSIALANAGSVPVTELRVTDPLDPLLDYQQGSAGLPAGVTGSAWYDDVSRRVNFEIAALPAGFSGTLTFRARVRPDAAPYGAVPNTVAVTSSLSATPVPSNTTLTALLPQELKVSKSAGTKVAEAGDIVTYTVRVENAGGGELGGVTLTDSLPRGFRYLKQSSQMDGRSLPDPAGGGREVVWNLGDLPAGGRRTLTYRCVVSADAPAGSSVNRVVASGARAQGGTAVSLPASALVKVRPSILGDKAIIMGKLFEDLNENGVADLGEPPLAGVRVYLEDGSYVFSDPEGQYSFTGVSAGDHVVKVDRSTLAPGYHAQSYNTAFAGVGWSQFVTVPFGGPARGDFAFTRRETFGAGNGALPPLPSLLGRVMLQEQVSHDSPSSHPSHDSQPPRLQPEQPSPSGQQPPPAEIAELRITPDRVDIPADARTVVPFTVILFDRQGRRVTGPGTVTVSLGRGLVLEPDADPAQAGHQVQAADGLAILHLRSTRSSGPDAMLVSAAGGATAVADLFFSEELRDWILVGLGSLTVGGRAVSGQVEKVGKDDRFDEGLFTGERLALFTRGKILGKYLVTAAYDSDKERRDGVFQSIDPEKYYPVYGDSSDIGYEAQSRGKLYLKLEAGRSYLLAGDYRTDLSENEFSRYDRALNGTKLVLEGEHLTAKAFQSRSEEEIVKDEIRGNGSSGYYFLSAGPVFENSERVRIEVRDRYHSERVLSVTEKVRYADYSVDYHAGTILFKEPVPSLDPYLNPVTIVVIYQSQGRGAKRDLYGGRLLWKSGKGSYLGATTVVEEGAVKDYTLYGVDAGATFRERVTLKGEWAETESWQRGKGSAWKSEVSTLLLDSLGLAAYYRNVDAQFFNPSMTGSESGTEKYGARVDYRPFKELLLFGESFVQRDEMRDVKEFGNQVGVLKRFSLWEAEGGYKRVEQEGEGSDTRSDILYAGARGSLTERLEATLRREQLLSSSRVARYQTKSFLKLDYRLSDATRAFVTGEYQEGSPLVRHATLFGLESRLSERMRLSTGYQLSSGVAGSTQQSSIDLNTRLLERDGLSLDSRTGYQLEHAMSQQRGQAILGLNSRYRAAEGLYLNSSLERVQTLQGNSGTRTAFTMAGEYLRLQDLKLTGRYEIRTGPEETASLYGAGFGYRLNRSLTLLGKATLWDSDADAGDSRIFDGYLGSSFRPQAGHPLQLLTLARYKVEERGSLPGSADSRSLILSAEPTYRLVRHWSAQGKYAGKLFRSHAAGQSFQSYSDLVLAGLSYDLAERWELAAYLRLMNQYDSGEHSLGAVASAGYRLYRNVVLNAGYNYARLDDRELTGESFQGHGPFVGVKVKFDEDMFENSEARVIAIAPPPPAKAAEPAAAPPAPRPEPAPVIPALLVAASLVDEPLQLSGSAELLTLLVNGEPAKLPSTAVTVSRERLDASVDLKGGRLASRLDFLTSVEEPKLVRSYSLDILDAAGNVLHSFKGNGPPQRRIGWSGETAGAAVREGEIYQYQLQVTYLDGSIFTTGRELLGVNRQEALLLTLAGGAFLFDRSELTEEAKLLLKGAARLLRAHPREKVIVEGHTDGIGTVKYNIGLSRRRCDAAADYLQHVERIPASRLVRRWYGKSRPIADNRTTDGRRLNRRVELKGEFREKLPVSPDDRYRAAPFVTVNDRPLPLDPSGRFDSSVPGDTATLKVEMGDSTGRWLATTLPVPGLNLATPAGSTLVSYGSSAGGVTVTARGTAHCMLSGSAQKGSTLELEGKGVQLDEAGRFALELPLQPGEQVYGMVLRNGAGCSKLLNLRLRSEAGANQEAGGGP